MIGREQVADLIAGDVVEVTFHRHPRTEITVRGTLETVETGGGGKQCLTIKGVTVDGRIVVVRRDDGSPSIFAATRSLVVISRAPRPKPPVYVNSDRTYHAVGDVVTYPFAFADNGLSGPYVYCEHGEMLGSPPRMTHWKALGRNGYDTGPTYNASKLTLLIDGETTSAVPS